MTTKAHTKKTGSAPAAKPRLVIVDQSLKDIRGHHFTLTRDITKSAIRAGFDVIWYCSTEFKPSPDLNTYGAEIRPVFKICMYDRYKKNSGAKAKGVSLEDSLLQALTQGFKADNITSADRVLLHTADGATYLAISKLILDLPAKSRPVFHICTPYDPVGVMPNRDDPDDIFQSIARLKEKKLIGKKAFYYGENPFLAEHLSEIWDIPVNPLELPASEDRSQISKTSLIQYRRETLGIGPNVFLTVYLGSARLEKGFQHLPYVVSRAFEFAGKGTFKDVRPNTFHFAFQSSPQIIGYHPDVKKALERMDVMPAGQVTCLRHSLSDEEYSKLLHAADAVILPYEADKYRVRGSGIVSEALTAGKIILATKNSYPAKRMFKGAGASAESPQEFAKAILSIIKNKEGYARNAKKGSIQYHKDNALQSYWPKCLKVENK
jgi:glycosyltransferase involved in cell wall biosynthesis